VNAKVTTWWKNGRPPLVQNMPESDVARYLANLPKDQLKGYIVDASPEGVVPSRIEITPAMVRQYNERRVAYSDPCIVCGGRYGACGHEDITPELINRIRKLGKVGRDEILRKGTR
jgi:hypothetical protein